MKNKIKKQKFKRQTFTVEGTQFDFVPFSNYNGIAHIRLERRGEYLFYLDGKKKNHKLLKHFKTVISDWLRQSVRSVDKQ